VLGLSVPVGGTVTQVGFISKGEPVTNLGPQTVYLGRNQVDASASTGIALAASADMVWPFPDGMLYAVCPNAATTNTPAMVQIGVTFNGLESDALSVPWTYERVNITSPAAGTDWIYAVPANKLYEILYLEMTLTTNATAGNRQPALRIDVPVVGGGFSKILDITRAGAATAASTAAVWVWQAGLPNDESFFFTAAITIWSTPMQQKIICPPGTLLRSVTFGMQAGDTLTGIFLTMRSYPSLNAVSLT
jgi:hypothetical protein